MKERTRKSRPIAAAAAIAAILVAAALLRWWGLHWGLPDSTHLFSYHPDEHFSLATALSLSFGGGWSPNYFNYGPLYMNLVALVGALANHLPTRDLQAVPEAIPRLILDARLVTVALGVLTVALVYVVGRDLFGRTSGLMAAAVLAIMPLHAVHGHFATVDVPATFWMVLSLVFAARILPHRSAGRRRRRDSPAFAPGRLYLLAGAAAGLAAATKYNSGLAIVFPLAAHVLRHGSGARDIRVWVRLVDRRVALAVVGLVVAFIVACPYAVLSPREWWGSAESHQGVAYEIHHMRAGEHPAVEATPPGAVFHLVGSLAYGLGWPTLALSIVAVVFALTKRRRRDWLLLSFLVAWYVVISLAKVRYMRYAIPLLPILALLVGRLLDTLMQRVAEPVSAARRAGVVLVRLAAVAALGHALVYTWAYDDAMAALGRPVGEARADCLLIAGVDRGDTVGLIWPPWFCHPPVEYVNGGAVLGEHRLWRQFRRSPYTVRALGYDPPEQLPQFFITTSFEVRDHRRARTRAWRTLKETLDTHYVRDEASYDPASRLGRLPGADMHDAPSDWLYPFPEISIYRLRADEESASREPPEGSAGPRVEEWETPNARLQGKR